MAQQISVSEYLQQIFQGDVVIQASPAKPGEKYLGVTVTYAIERPLASAAEAAAWIDEAETEFYSGVRLGLIVANESSQKPAQQGFQPRVEELTEPMVAGYKALFSGQGL